MFALSVNFYKKGQKLHFIFTVLIRETWLNGQ